MTKKKITLETLATQMAEGFAKHGKEIHDLTETVGFVIKHMATKEQIVSLHTQVNAIETQLRDIKHTKLHARIADLEEKVFGATRA
jgi:hypothetical protein